MFDASEMFTGLNLVVAALVFLWMAGSVFPEANNVQRASGRRS